MYKLADTETIRVGKPIVITIENYNYNICVAFSKSRTILFPLNLTKYQAIQNEKVLAFDIGNVGITEKKNLLLNS